MFGAPPRVVIVVPTPPRVTVVVPTPPRVAIVVPTPPRVVIVVPTVGLADWVGLPNPHSCRYCGTNPGFDFLLVSLTWFKPGERLSLANRWMCQYPWGKNTGVSVGSRTGGKVTCTNWVLNPWCEVQPLGSTPWCEVQTLGSTPWCEVQPLVS